MSLNAAMIQAMVDKGLSGQDIADIAKASEAKVDRTAAQRQSRHRAKRNAVTSRCDPPKEELQTPPSEISPSGETQKVKRARQQFPCPPDCNDLDWVGLLQNRETARKPVMTDSAYRTICSKLEGWGRDGWPPGAILANSAEKGWLTVFPTDEMKAQANGRQPRNTDAFASLRGSRPNGALDMVIQSERELAAEAERENPGFDWPARAALPPH